MTRRIPAVCVVFVLLGAVPATAQTEQQLRLKGVTAVNVVIGLNDESASCGITETGLTTAASKALLDNGVRVEVDELPTLSETPDLWVGVSSFIGSGGNQQCVSDIVVELYAYVTATPPHSAQPVFGRGPLSDCRCPLREGSLRRCCPRCGGAVGHRHRPR